MRRRTMPRTRLVHPAVVVALVAAFVAVVPVAPAVAAQSMTLSASSDPVLVGEDVSYSLRATNTGDEDLYNVTFRAVLPAGITYVPGSTRPDSVGDPVVWTSAEGEQTLVWRNVDDAARSGSVSLAFDAEPDTDVYPVGSTVPVDLDVYANSDPRLVPRFTPAGTLLDRSTASATTTSTTAVSAIALSKSEPSPEHELLRGVHDHPTTFTLRVRNNGSTPTDDVEVVDYLPAGLEFLGCGGVDNAPAGFEEYPGSGRLTGTPAAGADCATPVSVETVDSDLPAGYPAGVYTKVTWDVGTLAGGGSRTLTYAAGIPMRENVMPQGEFTGTANLTNNTGAPTREGATEKAYTNRAIASGTYTGTIEGDPADKTVSASARVTVTSEDVAVQKSVAPRTFVQGQVATYTLSVQGSEYTTASDVVLTDDMPNGLCPLDDETNHENTSAAECARGGSFAPTGGASYADVEDLDADGFRITFTPFELERSQVRTITYKARMRSAYEGSTEPTSSGDSFVNTVALQGRTTKVPASESGTDPVTVNDESQASIGTEGPRLDKTVGTQATPMSCAATSYIDNRAGDESVLSYRKGDRVCFKIRVDFSDATATRAPRVSDFLPDGVVYEAGSATPTAANDVTISTDEATGNPVFTIGDVIAGQRFVEPGAVFEVVLSGIVSTPGDADVDVKGNLAKFRYLDQQGRSQSLRDQVTFYVAPPPTVAIEKSVDDAEVRHGDVSTFSVKVTNASDTDDVEGNERAVDDVQVRDLLPPQYTCGDVSAISDGGACATVDGVAVVSWTVTTALAPGDSTTLTYRATTPTTTAAGRSYVNTAGVRSFAAATNVGTDGRTTHYPRENIDPAVTAAQMDAPPAKDTASVRLPAVEVEKTNVTDVDSETGNGDHDAVSGEGIDYTITATIPARTTVYRATLKDVLPANLQVTGSTIVFRPDAGSATTAPLPASIESDGNHGVRFPATYTNATETDQVVVLQIAARVAPGTTATGTRTNTATFTSTAGPADATGTESVQDTSDVQVKLPVPKLTKTSNPTSVVGAGQDVTYTLKAENTGPVPLHDAVLTDCLPLALTLDAGTLPSGATSAQATGSQCTSTSFTYITVPVGSLEPAESRSFTYTAKVAVDAAGGASYRNDARLVGSTLDDGRNDNSTETTVSTTANKTVTTTSASLTKSVLPLTPTIGDTVTYTVRATFAPNLNYFDAAVTDTVPTGLDLSSLSDVTVTCAHSTAPTTCPADATPLTASGRTVGWGLGDLAPDTASRVYTITYRLKVADVAGNTTGATPTNAANVRWSSVNGTDPTSAGHTWTRSGTQRTAAVTIRQPTVAVAKTVDEATPEPGQVFTYAVTATNPGGTNVSDAFEVVVTDRVPQGVVVDTDTISDDGSYDDATRTITWRLPQLTVGAPGNSRRLTYDARLAASGTLDGSALVNTATIAGYESRATGGRTYTGPSTTRSVTPQLPKGTVQKSVVGGPTAEVGKDKTFRVVVRNTGAATATVDVTDTLPTNWVLGSSATVGIGSATAQPTPPQVGDDDPRVLTWPALGPVAPGQDVVITYTARPTADATTSPGSGSSVPHVNTAAIVVKDATGATGSKTGSYAGPDATAEAQINRADLTLEKKGDGTLVAGRPYSWKLTVGNAGPDAATGEIVLTDELPDELTGYTASGTGWSCSVGTTDVTCRHAGPVPVGGTLPVVTVTGQVPSDLGTTASITNSAEVEGSVFESVTTNNTATSTVPVTALADVAVAKKLSGSLVAGQTATWTLDVTNLGPSTARGPLTVKDTLPSGTTFVSAEGDGWTCDEAEGVVTCTSEEDLARDAAAPQLVVAVDIPADRTAAVENVASVKSATPEPVTPTASANDRDSAEDTPTRTALLTTSKVVEGDTQLVAGATGTYVIGVANAGPSTATDVTVTDTLPEGLTYRGARGTGWSCDEDAGTVTCTLSGSIAPKGSAGVEIDVEVGSDQTGEIVNTAKAVAEEDPDGSEAVDGNVPDQDSDYTVEKSHTGDATAGTSLDYTIEVTNRGPSDSPGPLAVEDRLPAGMTFADVSGGGWTCEAGQADETGQDVACSRTGGLADDASTSFTLTVDVAADAGPATLVNSVAVSGPQETDVSNNTDSDPTVVVDEADVSLTKTAAVDTVDAGAELSWTLGVENAGPSDADAVTVSDTMPAGLTVTSVAGDGWTCETSDAAFSCSRPTLAPGAAPSLTLVTKVGSGVDASTVITNTATVTTTTPGDDDEDNTDADDVSVTTHADLAVSKTHTGTPVAGRPFAFTIGVENEGPSDARSPITLTDELPPGMTYVGTPGPWTCVAGPVATAGQTVECELAPTAGLAAGASTPDLVMTVDVASDASGDELVNVVTVASDTDDPESGNDEARDTVTPTGSADLSITKSHRGEATVGSPLEFTLQVRNDGPSEARDVEVADLLPDGLTLESISGEGWTCDDDAASCTLDEPLAVDTDADPITVVATVEPGSYPAVGNVATVSSATPDPESGNDRDVDEVTVPALVDLSIDKQVEGELTVGRQGTYTLTVRNDGPTADPGPVTVTDTLPAGLTYVSAEGEGWRCAEDAGTVTCVDEDGLVLDESSSVLLTVDVGAAAYPTVVNTARVATPSEQTDTDDDTSTVEAPVAGSALVSIDKSLAEQDDRTAVWTLEVHNAGPTETTADVVVTDALPKGLTLVSAAGRDWTCETTSRRATCTYDGRLGVDQTSEIELRTTLTAAAGETVTNVASVSAGGLGGDASVDDATVTVPAEDGGLLPGGLLPSTGGPAWWLLLLGMLGLAVGTGVLRRREG